jgi:hypothetical protein
MLAFHHLSQGIRVNIPEWIPKGWTIFNVPRFVHTYLAVKTAVEII